MEIGSRRNHFLSAVGIALSAFSIGNAKAQAPTVKNQDVYNRYLAAQASFQAAADAVIHNAGASALNSGLLSWREAGELTSIINFVQAMEEQTMASYEYEAQDLKNTLQAEQKSERAAAQKAIKAFLQGTNKDPKQPIILYIIQGISKANAYSTAESAFKTAEWNQYEANGFLYPEEASVTADYNATQKAAQSNPIAAEILDENSIARKLEDLCEILSLYPRLWQQTSGTDVSDDFSPRIGNQNNSIDSNQSAFQDDLEQLNQLQMSSPDQFEAADNLAQAAMRAKDAYNSLTANVNAEIGPLIIANLDENQFQGAYNTVYADELAKALWLDKLYTLQLQNLNTKIAYQQKVADSGQASPFSGELAELKNIALQLTATRTANAAALKTLTSTAPPERIQDATNKVSDLYSRAIAYESDKYKAFDFELQKKANEARHALDIAGDPVSNQTAENALRNVLSQKQELEDVFNAAVIPVLNDLFPYPKN